MKSILTIAVTALLLQPITSFAAHNSEKHSHKNKPAASTSLGEVIVKPNEAVFEVHGIVCSFCSVGVQKKLSKLPFIDTSKYTKGVYVEIEKQKVTIAIKPSMKLDAPAAFDSIRSGGYEPIKVMTAGTDGVITTYTPKGE